VAPPIREPIREPIRARNASYAGFGTRELYLDGSGPAFVLLHGFGHPADCWGPVLTRLAAADRASVAVDLPDFGAADRTSPGPRLPQLDRFVAELVAHHGADSPVVLVGNSLSGLLTVRAAVSPAVPIRAALPTAVPGFGWTPLIRRGTIGNLRPVVLLSNVPAPQAIRQLCVDSLARVLMYGRPAAADPAMVTLLTGPLGDRSGRREVMRAVVAYAAEVGTDQRAGEIRCPVTIVHGRRDRIVSLAASKRLQTLIPHSKLVVLERAGHCPHLDAPDDITALALRLAAVDGKECA
jgi:pimeloyl-ACP methyl ester carboxylesterase